MQEMEVHLYPGCGMNQKLDSTQATGLHKIQQTKITREPSQCRKYEKQQGSNIDERLLVRLLGWLMPSTPDGVTEFAKL